MHLITEAPQWDNTIIKTININDETYLFDGYATDILIKYEIIYNTINYEVFFQSYDAYYGTGKVASKSLTNRYKLNISDIVYEIVVENGDPVTPSSSDIIVSVDVVTEYVM